jgi:signal transduction histidine kinase
LNIISGQTQALICERGEDGELIQDLNMIMEEIVRIDKIVDGLLAFSRKGSNQATLLDVNDELESLLSFLESDMSCGGIQVVRRFAEDLPSIKADSDHLRQVFFNIINNAKFVMEEGGQLTITTEPIVSHCLVKRRGSENHEGFVCIKISDTGPGIKQENIEKIFEPFFTTKAVNTGTGLGLSVCHSIVEQSGGTLEVESEYGKGATFILKMPFSNPNDKSVEQTAPMFIDSEGKLGQGKWDSIKFL